MYACPQKENGFIVLHRKMLKWEWYQKSEMVHLFLHLLLSANHEDSRWQGIEIKRGQLLTGRKSLCKNTHISQRKLRTCITRLKTTNEIATKTTNRYTIITIVKYDDYQNKEKNRPAKRPANRPTTDQQPTTNNNDNKRNNCNADANLFLNFFYEEYLRVSGKKPIITNFERYNLAVRPFIKSIGLEKLKELAVIYLKTDDKYWDSNNYGINTFLTDFTINKLIKLYGN